MTARYSDEFRRRAVARAAVQDVPLSALAAELGVSSSCLRRWIRESAVATPWRTAGNAALRATPSWHRVDL